MKNQNIKMKQVKPIKRQIEEQENKVTNLRNKVIRGKYTDQKYIKEQKKLKKEMMSSINNSIIRTI